MDEQKIIDIKVQVDKSDVDKSFKDIQKQSQQTSDKVSKSSKKMNDAMMRDAKKSTDKLQKQFQDLQKQMTKALDSTKLGRQLSNTLSKVKTQISDTLGNINITANVRTNSQQQTSQPNSQSQIGLGGLGGAVASGAVMNSQLAQMHDTLSSISNVKVTEVFEDVAPEIQDVIKGVENFKQELEQNYAELGEEFDFSEFNKSFEAQFQSIQQAFDKLNTDKTGNSFRELQRLLSDLESQLSALGINSKELNNMLSKTEAISKRVGMGRKGATTIVSDEQIATVGEAVNKVKELESLARSGLNRVSFLEGIEQDIANLTQLQNKLGETGRKAEAIKLGNALNDFAQRAREAGLELNNVNDMQRLFNDIMNSSSRLTKQQCQAMLQYSDNTIVGLHRITQAQQQQVQSTNTVAQSQTRLQKVMQGLSQSYQTYAPKIQSCIDKIKTKTAQWLSSHKKTADGIQNANKKMSSSFKSLLNAMMPFLSIYAVFSGIKTSITNAMESIETDNMFNTVFGSSSQEMNQWVSEVNKTLGLGITNTKQYTATISQMGRAMGLTGTQAMEMSQKMATMAGDISSFYNVDLSQAQQDLQSALSGSNEVLTKYGIVLREDIIKQYAYANGIATMGAELTSAQRAMTLTMMVEQQLGVANGDLAHSLEFGASYGNI